MSQNAISQAYEAAKNAAKGVREMQLANRQKMRDVVGSIPKVVTELTKK